MVTDEILCAVQGMIELFPTPEARNAGKAIASAPRTKHI